MIRLIKPLLVLRGWNLLETKSYHRYLWIGWKWKGLTFPSLALPARAPIRLWESPTSTYLLKTSIKWQNRKKLGLKLQRTFNLPRILNIMVVLKFTRDKMLVALDKAIKRKSFELEQRLNSENLHQKEKMKNLFLFFHLSTAKTEFSFKCTLLPDRK